MPGLKINQLFFILIPIIMQVLPIHPPAMAEMKTFLKEYSYQANEFESKILCRTIALEQVKRLFLEELGTCLEGYTDGKNFQPVSIRKPSL